MDPMGGQEGEALTRQGGGRAEAQAQPSGQALRMLAAYLDASAHLELRGEHRVVRAQLQGLRLETRVDLGAREGEVRATAQPACGPCNPSPHAALLVVQESILERRSCHHAECGLLEVVSCIGCHTVRRSCVNVVPLLRPHGNTTGQHDN